MIYRPDDYRKNLHTHIDNVRDGGQETSVKFGIEKIDNNIIIDRSDLVVFLARPGHGKTALMLSLVRQAAVTYNSNPNKFAPPIFITKETAIEELALRNLANFSGIDLRVIKSGKDFIDWKKLHKQADEMLNQFPLIFIGHSLYNKDDRKKLNARDAMNAVAEIHDEYGNSSVLLSADYLQRFSLPKHTEQRGMYSEIMELFKDVSLNENVPFILGSQALRVVDTLKFPVADGSHSKETGNIEETCDKGFSCMRPIKYWKAGTVVPNSSDNLIVTPELFYLSLWKDRSGIPEQGFWLEFDMRIYEMSDLEIG